MFSIIQVNKATREETLVEMCRSTRFAVHYLAKAQETGSAEFEYVIRYSA